MDKFFFWLSDNPPTPDIPLDKWTEYLSDLAVAAILFIAAIVAVTVVMYWRRAAYLRIHKPVDLFAPYTPMRWLFLAFVVLFGVGGLAAWRYKDVLGSDVGMPAVALEIGVWSCLLAFAVSYLVILIPGITPAKFRYRPLWLFYKNKGVKA